MITQDLEALKGKVVKTQSGQLHTVLGSYVTEHAGLVLVTVKEVNGQAFMETVKVVGIYLEIVK